jgi:hypothetical protein
VKKPVLFTRTCGCTVSPGKACRHDLLHTGSAVEANQLPHGGPHVTPVAASSTNMTPDQRKREVVAAARHLREMALKMPPGPDSDAIAVILDHIGELERTLEQIHANHESISRHWPAYAIHLVKVR